MFALRSIATLTIALATMAVAAPSEAVTSTAVASSVVPNAIASGNATAHANISSAAAQVDGHIFACVDLNFTGICANFPFNVGQCLNFQFDFQDSISSIGPDRGFNCFLFIDMNCKGASIPVSFPGTTLLPSQFNDQVSSFQCFRQ